MKTMKRKKPAIRSKILTFLLFSASLACTGLCLAHLIPYAEEEMRAASLHAELIALHEGGAGIDEVSAAKEPDTFVVEPDSYAALEGEGQPVAVENDGNAGVGDSMETPEAAEIEDAAGVQQASEVHSGLAALHQKNRDCIAWITIEDTAIDYPVMYRPQSKDYYIYRDFYGERSSSGSLYISEICDPDTCDNLIIYGHHMSSGTMFAALDKYKKQSFYEAHPTIRLERLSGVETYEIVFAFTTPVYTGNDFKYYAFARAANEAEFNAYIANCQARALYDTGKTASYGDKLLTLSTCEYSQKNGRMVVVARRMDA